MDWTPDNWARVLWTDESKCNMKGSDGAQCVLRRPGEELMGVDRCTKKTVKHAGGHIMTRGCMCAAGPARLYKVNGLMKNDHMYIYIGFSNT